jgi:hypothetical protein
MGKHGDRRGRYPIMGQSLPSRKKSSRLEAVKKSISRFCAVTKNVSQNAVNPLQGINAKFLGRQVGCLARIDFFTASCPHVYDI